MNATSRKINLKNLRSDINSLKKSLLNLNFQTSFKISSGRLNDSRFKSDTVFTQSSSNSFSPSC